jgi:hypothetical protein
MATDELDLQLAAIEHAMRDHRRRRRSRALGFLRTI